MRAISYIPSKDELRAQIRPPEAGPSRKVGHFEFWWDDRGIIYAILIKHYFREREEFRRDLNTVRLGGMWKGVKITAEEIEEARKELLQTLEEKWQ